MDVLNSEDSKSDLMKQVCSVAHMGWYLDHLCQHLWYYLCVMYYMKYDFG